MRTYILLHSVTNISRLKSNELPSQNETLIPSLPNDLSSFILSLIPYSHHSRLKSISNFACAADRDCGANFHGRRRVKARDVRGGWE
ncbi:hypothetical protein Syun_025860 [Stephania yunnanensis]|uniref:Uncharacterized protein n=1 Tax=Stephania yunnanensis TaxID=152371 RepID=A0AAP0ESG2_9MAGN